MSRGMRFLLIGSLVLNLFVVGGIAGAALMWNRVETPPAQINLRRPALREAAASLSPDQRRQFRRTVGQSFRALRPEAEKARAARREVARLLTQPTLDRPALDAALAGARASDARIRLQIETDLAIFLRSLPDDQRIAFGEALVRANERQAERRRQQASERRQAPARRNAP